MRQLPGVVVIGLAVLVAACSGEEEAKSAPLELRVPIDRDVRSLDPHQGSIDVVSHNVLRQLFEGLVDYDPQTLEPVPRLAREWTVRDDGLEWTFTLREGVRFSDNGCTAIDPGRELGAEDVRRSIERGLVRHRGTSAISTLPPFVGLEAFLAGEAEHVEGISADGPRRLQIRLEQPDPLLPHFLALPACFVIATDVVEECGDELPVGTGPFRLISWTRGSRMLLAAHRDYWWKDDDDVALPYIDALRFVVTTDGRRQYALRETDLYYTYDREEQETGDAGERRFDVAWLNTIYLRFNFRSDHPVGRLPSLRRALSLVATREFAGRLHLPAGRLLPPGLPGRDAGVELQRSDPEEARRLLAAGDIDPESIPPIRIGVPYTDEMTGFWLQRGLEELGLTGTTVVVDRAELERLVASGEVDVFRDGWVADYPDPQNFLQLFYSESATNPGGYRSDEYDDVYEELRRETVKTRRTELAARLEEILHRDTPAIFVRHERLIQWVAPRVGNWEFNGTNPLNVHFYERVRIDR